MPPRKKTVKVDDNEKPLPVKGMINIHAVIDSHPLDAAYALNRAMTLICGKDNWAGVSYEVMTPWGTKHTVHPTTLRIPTGVHTSDTVVWGSRMEAPSVFGGYITSRIGHKRKRPVLELGGNVLPESNEVIQRIISRTEQFIRESSIFRGKAIQLMKQESDMSMFGPIEDIFGTFPKFLDLSNVREDELRYPAETLRTIQTTLFTPVEQSLACRQAGVPLKRGILLEGTYGVGKTLCAFVTAKKAVENGFTFIYLDNIDRLEEGVLFALNYQPAVLYGEDVDQARGIHERSSNGNRILNALDSIESKGSELITVLTTNHLKGITPALLRPGRMDAVIHIPEPDRDTVVSLLAQYGRGLIHPSVDLGYIAGKLAGCIPAVVREVVERAKLAAIMQHKDAAGWQLSEHDLLRETAGMLEHVKLTNTIKEAERLSDREKAARIRADAELKWQERGYSQPLELH